jgi:hypothetical protein
MNLLGRDAEEYHRKLALKCQSNEGQLIPELNVSMLNVHSLIRWQGFQVYRPLQSE